METSVTISHTGTALLLFESRPPRNPPKNPAYMPIRVRNAASIAKKLATVMIRTSRFATCESSWARTPSISFGSSRRQRPVVTATTACFGLRPVAKAFGTSVSTTATRGFGRSDMAHSRSTMSCSSGASCRSTIFAPEAATTSTTSASAGGGTTTSGGSGASGKALFTSNGCVSCHTYKPAGSKATIGPDLDKLTQYAKQAKQPLEPFVRTSITDPNAYVQPGFPRGVMPTFATLTKSQVHALVTFLTKGS